MTVMHVIEFLLVFIDENVHWDVFFCAFYTSIHFMALQSFTSRHLRSAQVMMSIRTLLKGEEAAAEALRRAKCKFPGRQVPYAIFLTRFPSLSQVRPSDPHDPIICLSE